MKKYINKVTIGVASVLVLYASVAMVTVFARPWWPNKGDGPYHADYVYQLYNGELPDWDEGIKYPAFVEKVQSPDSGYPGNYKHIASPHPPLFYAIQAPFMGPLLNSGEWEKAFAVGRTVNVVLGMILGALMAYAAWLYGGRFRAVLAILVPLFGLFMGQFINLANGLVNDVLVAIFATLTMIVIHRMYTRGVTLRNVMIYSVVAAFGMLSKATFIMILAPSFLLLGYLVYRSRKRLSVRRTVALLAAPIVLVFLVSGWFYIGNFLQSGDFTRAGSQDWISDRREAKDLVQLLTTAPFYEIFYKQLATHYHVTASIVISVAAAVSLLYVFFGENWKKTNRLMKKNWPLLIFFAAMAVLIIIAQIKHAIPYGMYNIRYFLPLIFPISMLFAYALMNIPLLKQYWNVIVAIVLSYSVLYAASLYRGGEAGVDGLRYGFEMNYVPTWFLWILLSLGLAALVAIVASLTMIRDATEVNRNGH